MNVFKRLLNVITFGIFIFFIGSLIWVYSLHGEATHYFPDSHYPYLSEKYGLSNEYEQASLNYIDLQMSSDLRKLIKAVGGVSNNDYDSFVNEHSDDEFKAKYIKAKEEHDEIINRLYTLESNAINFQETTDRIIVPIIFILIGLLLVLVINYISFGKIQLIHKATK